MNIGRLTIRRAGSGLAVAALCIPALPGAAQNTGMAALTGAPAEPVSHDEIMENPDDIGLNLRYARTLISKGRLEQAAVTLERILILHPERDRIRLLYAIVLYRLDNIAEAEQELNSLLEAGNLPETLAQQAQRYRARARRRQQSLSGVLTLGGGVHVDSNRNRYPESDEFRIGGTVVDGQENQNADVGQLGFGELRLDYDPGQQRLSSLYFKANGFVDNQTGEDELDVTAGFGEFGARINATVARLTPHLRYERLRLGGADYAQIPEAGLRASRRIRAVQGLRAFVGGRLAYEDFNDTDVLPANSEQNGLRYDLTAGAEYDVSDAWRLAASYRLQRKDADAGYESFVAHRGRFTASYVFPRQIVLSGTARLEHRNFDSPNSAISASTERRDLDTRLRGTLGIPFSAVIMAMGTANPDPATRDLVISVSGSYETAESNIRNFDYANWRGSILVTKRFEF